MRRLVPLAAVLAGVLLAPASTPASSLTRCPDDLPFNVAIYVKGDTCHHALTLLSSWRTHHACQQHSTCRIGVPLDNGHTRQYGCSQSYRTDHKQREYWAIACFTDDRHHDVRGRDYPHGDYKPDR